MFESERYRTEIEQELTFDKMLKILDDISAVSYTHLTLPTT